MESGPLTIFVTRLGMVSLQSLVLVALIGAICRAWPRLPSTIRCSLWWLASLQLVLGLMWPAPLELPWWPGENARVTILATPADVDGVNTFRPAREAVELGGISVTTTDADADIASRPHDIEAPAPQFPWRGVLAWLWLTGVVMTALQSLQAYQQARRWRMRSRECDDAAVQSLYRRTGHVLGLGVLPPLFVSDDIASPQLLGPWRPRVLLPAQALTRFSDDDLRMALHHELSHFRRRDLWWGWIPAIARHLFFFHPAAHLITREYSIAREAACDEAVMSCTHHDAHAYGHLLLRLGIAPRPCAGLASASPTYQLLKRRLLMLQNTGSRPHFIPLAIVAALVALFALPYQVVAGADRPAVSALPIAAAQASPASAPKASVKATPAAKPAPAVIASASTHARPVVAAVATPTVAASATPAVRTNLGDGRGGEDGYSYVLMEGQHVTANAESGDFAAAKRVRGDDASPMLWVREGNQTWAIRDAPTVQRAQDVWKAVNALGEQQAQLGSQQAALGKQQATLGQQQAQFGSQMAVIGSSHAKIASRHAAMVTGGREISDRQQAALDRDIAQLDQRMDDLARQQATLGDQQAALGTQQSALGEKQAALGERQAQESARAHRRMQQLIADAIKRGLAQPIAR